MDSSTRWLSILGIGTLCFGISLFVLRIPIRTIIVFFIAGVPLVALWLYVDAKSKQKRITTTATVTTQACICSICKQRSKELLSRKLCMSPRDKGKYYYRTFYQSITVVLHKGGLPSVFGRHTNVNCAIPAASTT